VQTLTATYAVVNFRRIRHKSNFAQFGISQSYTYKKKQRLAAIQTPVHRNFICRSQTPPALMLSPSSLLPLPSSRCTYFPASKTSGRSFKIFLFNFFFRNVWVWYCTTWNTASRDSPHFITMVWGLKNTSNCLVLLAVGQYRTALESAVSA
jgi:hypothetical protein